MKSLFCCDNFVIDRRLTNKKHSSRMRTVRSSSRLPGGGGCPPEGCLPRGCVSQHARRQTPLWTEWLTDRCKNITFPSFADGKYRWDQWRIQGVLDLTLQTLFCNFFPLYLRTHVTWGIKWNPVYRQQMSKWSAHELLIKSSTLSRATIPFRADSEFFYRIQREFCCTSSKDEYIIHNKILVVCCRFCKERS